MSGSDSTYAAIFGDSVSVLERVLLAIIEAHTTPETEGRQGKRLEAAITALIGPVTPRECDLERALLYMARQRQKDACDLEMAALRLCGGAHPRTARSISTLATLAAGEVLGIIAADEVQATANNLCNMFRRRSKVHAVECDHAREAREAEAVQRLCADLAEWDVPTRL
jgi:hypothetical protein